MSKERELLKRVRDTLRELKETHYDLYWDIQAELDLDEQEPVAWMSTKGEGGLTDDSYYANLKDYVPLYLAPTKRELLSDDEIFKIGYNAGFALDHVENDDDDCSAYGFLNEYGYIDNNPYFKFVRAIEKAHGIGVENE
jgi:hypothetical protein